MTKSVNLTNLAGALSSVGVVPEAKIGTGAVTEPKLGNLAVTENKLASNAVTVNKIADGAVSAAKLLSTDWTQLADVSDEIKALWAPYRQALRDVPQQTGFPDEIVWPVKP